MRIGGISTRLIRVYSETVEHEEFPMPGHLVAFKTRSKLADRQRDASLRSISLHHLIREGDSPMAVFISDTDRKIDVYLRRLNSGGPRSYDGTELTDDCLKEYRNAIATREKEVLSEGSIILCTCTTSSAKRIRDATNIQQVSIVYCYYIGLPISLYSESSVMFW